MNKQLVPKLVEANLQVLNEELFSKFPVEYRELLQAAQIAVVRSTEAFVDDSETPDIKQLEKIWLTFAGTAGIPFAVEKGQLQVDKIKDEVVKNLAKVLLPHAGATLSLLTDDNPENVKQIGEYWKGVLANDEVRNALMDNVLEPLIKKLVNNPLLAGVIVTIVRSSLKDLI